MVQLLTKLQQTVRELVYSYGRICSPELRPAILSIQNCLKVEQGGGFNCKWTWSGSTQLVEAEHSSGEDKDILV